MSDTPRTDNVIKNCSGWHHVPVEISRELERELIAAQEKIRRLTEAGDRFVPIVGRCEETHQWQQAKEAKP